MDWDLKMPPWDLAELETDSGPSMGPLVGQTAAAARGPDCSVDLKLGGLGDFGLANNWRSQTKGPAPVAAVMLPPSSAGPSKRPRAAGNGSQITSCLVEGCKADLSKCREYHRRHKVCEVHSKTPIVMVAGREQRFCQQCSRFHLLVEFDEAKRSCRKRLDGHNRRRRKPQPDPINSGSFMTSRQATRFSSYPPIFPTTRPDPNWTGFIKSEDSPFFAHHDPLHLNSRQPFSTGTALSHGKGGRQFPFLQDGDANFSGRVTLKTVTAPSKSRGDSGSNSKMFPVNGLAQVLDSDCALSLLSSRTPTSAINISPIVQPASQIPMGQPLLPNNLHFSSGFSHSLCPPPASGAEDERLSTIMASSSNVSGLNYRGIFHVRGEGSSDGALHSLPFSWQ